MKVRFLAEAEAELDAAVAFYEGRAAGLGLNFAREVRTGLTRIQEHPQAWQRLDRRVRRYRLDRFPYGLVYAVLPAEIVVVAVMNLRKRPLYWKSRLKQV